MDLLLQHQQSVIRQLRTSAEPIIYVQKLFDEIIKFLNNSSNNRNDSLHILTVICTDLSGSVELKCFNNLNIMNHEFFIILSETFTMLLTKITFIRLTKSEEQCFDAISLLISNLCLYKNKILTCFYTDNNEQLNPKNPNKLNLLSYEKIFFTDLFIKKFVRILKNDITKNVYDLYDIKYKVLNRLLYLFNKLNYVDNESIVDSIVECIESKIYIELYETIEFSQPILTPKQSFFMYQCPKFICNCCHKQQTDTIRLLCKSIVEYGPTIFIKHLPIIFNDKNSDDDDDEGEEEKEKKEDKGIKMRSVAWYTELLNHFALIPAARVCFTEKGNSKKSMIDQIISILRTDFLIKNVLLYGELFHPDVVLISYSMTILYNLTFELKIFYELKDKNVIDICKKFYQAKNRTIQFVAQTLCAILKKEYIDQMANPADVARSFLYMIENTIDDLSLTYHGIKLDCILTNLEDIVQNDDVKEEITNDEEGLPLIARCVYGPNLDDDTIRSPALRIIHDISFINDLAVKQIKDNDLLIEYIKNLAENRNKQQIPVVNRIFWKIEEDEYILKQNNPRKRILTTTKKVFDEKKAIYQYVTGDHRFRLDNQGPIEKFDIMISYCQDDKEFAEKLYNRLIESNFYRVSFDKDNIHYWNPQAMAKAIEQSTIIIMCFSTKYRNSYACRLEAEYAKKRDHPIIPIKIERQYNPTGWLTTIVENDNWIDFSNSEFSATYAKLIDKINEEYETMAEK